MFVRNMPKKVPENRVQLGFTDPFINKNEQEAKVIQEAPGFNTITKMFKNAPKVVKPKRPAPEEIKKEGEGDEAVCIVANNK